MIVVHKSPSFIYIRGKVGLWVFFKGAGANKKKYRDPEKLSQIRERRSQNRSR